VKLEVGMRTHKLVKLALFGLGLAASFVLFDRLLFISLREGASRYFASVGKEGIRWRESVGEGEERILAVGTSRAHRGFRAEVLSSLLNKKVSKEAGTWRYPQFYYYLYQNYKKRFGTPNLFLYAPDYFMFEMESKNLERIRRDGHAFPGKEGRFFERLLEDLENDGVPVFLVFIPDYIGTNETNFQQERFKRDIGRIAASPKKIRVLDYNRPEAFDLDDPGLFLDGGWGRASCHLNSKGALLFSRHMAEDIREILKADRRGQR